MNIVLKSFYRRMDELFSRTVDIVRKENIQVLNVWELGDEFKDFTSQFSADETEIWNY